MLILLSLPWKKIYLFFELFTAILLALNQFAIFLISVFVSLIRTSRFECEAVQAVSSANNLDNKLVA